MVREPTCARRYGACFAYAGGGRNLAGALSLAAFEVT
jgi:hypothetical protein